MLTIIDVSGWQGAVDWAAVRRAGIRLAFVKATEGRHYRDPQLARNRHEAATHGIRLGCYHFAHPGQGAPEAEAQHFAAVVGKLGRRDLRPVLDLEVENGQGAEAWARRFMREARLHLGVYPLLYSFPAYLEALHASKPIGGGLWLASFGRNDGADHGASVPRPWRRYVAHQFSSNGRVTGLREKVDLSHAPRLRPLLAHPVTGRL